MVKESFEFINFAHKRLKEIEVEAAKQPEMSFDDDMGAMEMMGQRILEDGGDGEDDGKLVKDSFLEDYESKKDFIVFGD